MKGMWYSDSGPRWWCMCRGILKRIICLVQASQYHSYFIFTRNCGWAVIVYTDIYYVGVRGNNLPVSLCWGNSVSWYMSCRNMYMQTFRCPVNFPVPVQWRWYLLLWIILVAPENIEEIIIINTAGWCCMHAPKVTEPCDIWYHNSMNLKGVLFYFPIPYTQVVGGESQTRKQGQLY